MTNSSEEFSSEISSDFSLFSENNILRCPICCLIPEIKYDFYNNNLEYLCKNNHSEKGDFNSIYQKLKLSNLSNVKCFNCNKKSNKYCIKCFKFYCEEHSKIDEKNCKHKIIDKNKIDKICFEHFDSIVAFCNDDKKPICINCINCYDNHNIKFFRKIEEKKIDEFKEKLNKFKKEFFMKNDDFINKINEFEECLIKILKKIKELKNDYLKEKKINFEFFLSFFVDLINSYELKINNKNERNLNYNIFNNLENNFSLNFNTKILDKIHKFKFIELSKIFSDLKFNLNKLNIENSNFFNLSNSKNFYFSYSFCLKNLHDNRLILGNYESKLIIFNQNLIKIDIEIENNLESIYDIQELKNLNVACCFKAKAIRIFKIEKNNYQIIQTILNAHSNWIYKIIELNNNNLLSCSEDKSIKIWKTENNFFKENFVLFADDYIKNIIEIKKNIIIYNVSYNKIEIYDLNLNKKIKIFNNLSLSTKIGSQFILINNKLIIGGDKKIYIINNNFEIENSFEYNSNIVSVLYLFNEFFAVGDAEGTISIFNLLNNKPILIKNNAHEGSIRALAYLNYSIFSVGTDEIIKKWEE